MKTNITVRKIALCTFILIVIFSATFVFHYTQSFYEAFAQGSRYSRQARYSEALPLLISAYKMKPKNMRAASFLLRFFNSGFCAFIEKQWEKKEKVFCEYNYNGESFNKIRSVFKKWNKLTK